MTWANRFRLFFGLIAVILIVGALTIVFSQRKGETTSVSASVEAETYPVGTDYAGSFVDQKVKLGDEVSEGDTIGVIQSNSLLKALDEGTEFAENGVYTVKDDGTLTVKSTVDGIIQELNVKQGGYAASGSTIATVAATNSLYVTAEFILDPKDFDRIEKGAKVTLEFPNAETIVGEVSQIEVETVDGKAKAIVRVDSKDLKYGGQGGLVAPGTPIVAEMKLRNDDVLARLVGTVRDFTSDLIGALTR